MSVEPIKKEIYQVNLTWEEVQYLYHVCSDHVKYPHIRPLGFNHEKSFEMKRKFDVLMKVRNSHE